MPRILVIVPAPVSGEQLELRRAQAAVAGLPEDVEVDYRAVRASADNQVSHHDYALSEICILEAGLTAAEEGYDAVCIDTVSDSGVNTLRSMLDIPVIGPGRTSYLVALMLGNRFSVVTMWDRWKPLVKKTLTDLQMLDRCASIRTIGMEPDTRGLLEGKEDETFSKMLEAARLCIDEDGAEVICLGSTTMHDAAEFLEARLEVPVVNPGPLSYQVASSLIRLRLAQSRAAWPSPVKPKEEMIRAMIEAATGFTE